MRPNVDRCAAKCCRMCMNLSKSKSKVRSKFDIFLSWQLFTTCWQDAFKFHRKDHQISRKYWVLRFTFILPRFPIYSPAPASHAAEKFAKPLVVAADMFSERCMAGVSTSICASARATCRYLDTAPVSRYFEYRYTGAKFSRTDISSLAFPTCHPML